MKKAINNLIIAFLAVSAVVVVLFFSIANTYAAAMVTRVAVTCDLFASLDTMVVELSVPQNAEVSPTGRTAEKDGVGYSEVTYGIKSGFVATRNLYKTDKTIGAVTATAKVTTDRIGVGVEVKKYPMQSETIATLKDGTEVSRIVDGVQYGEYTEIVYGDGVAFVRTDNLTDGLTYYQTIAIIVGVVAAGLAVLVIALLVYGKKIRNLKTR